MKTRRKNVSPHNSEQMCLPFQVRVITVALVALDWLIAVTWWIVTSAATVTQFMSHKEEYVTIHAHTH